MLIYLGADHRGFELKKSLKKFLESKGHKVKDVGAFSYDEDDDYPDFAKSVVFGVSENLEDNRGILICGSGHGMDMVANRYKEIRAALGFNSAVAKQSREHEDSNVLVLPSDWLNENEAEEIVDVWLGSKFDGALRNIRRMGKVKEAGDENHK